MSAVLALCLAAPLQAIAQAPPADENLRVYAVHVNRTPPQSWPGYGMYLGNGLILTASHVPGPFAAYKPRALIAGLDLPTRLVKEGALADVDLTLLAVDAEALPVRMRMRRLPLCDKPPFAGESVVTVTPEAVAPSHVLSPAAVPARLRGRFDTLIADVATTGNSGSGVLDVERSCLLGVISRKLSVSAPGARPGEPVRTTDIAKYFVPVQDIRAFIPAGVAF